MNATPYRPTRTAALILSPDALGGALVAAAVEMTGIQPLFLEGHESPRDAMRRGRPAYVMIDCTDASAADEAVLGPAMMMGARIFLFGDARTTRRGRALALQFQIGLIEFPRDCARLAAILAPPDRDDRETVQG